MRKPFTALATLVMSAAMLVASCDEAGPRTQVTYVGAYGSMRALGAEARAGRPVPVHAVNNPFGGDMEMAGFVADTLSARDRYMHFTPAGGGIPEGGGGPRVLVLVDTPTAYTGISACQGKPYIPESRAERIILHVMVCDEIQRLVEVMGVLPRASRPLETEFEALLTQAAGELLVGEDKSPK